MQGGVGRTALTGAFRDKLFSGHSDKNIQHDSTKRQEVTGSLNSKHTIAEIPPIAGIAVDYTAAGAYAIGKIGSAVAAFLYNSD